MRKYIYIYIIYIYINPSQSSGIPDAEMHVHTVADLREQAGECGECYH